MVIETNAPKTDDRLNEQQARRLMKYYEAIKQYVRSRPADTGKISQMLQDIKGSRNLRDTAAELNTNASTLSRAINETTAHISDDLVIAMAEAADERPDLTFTFQDIVEANGMELRDEARPKQLRAYGQNVRNTFVTGLVTHGYSVQQLNTEVKFGTAFPYILDFSVQCSRDGRDIYVGAEWKKFSYFEDGKNHYGNRERVARQALERSFAIMYGGQTSLDKMFLIIDSEKTFSWLETGCSGMKIPDDISILLVSPEGNEILQEYAIPKRDSTEYLMFS